MNYLVSKSPIGDSRKGICGVVIPDGFFVVIEYTEETQPQLQNIKKLPGDMYSVTKTDLPVGHYAPNGCRVTLSSLWNWYLYQEPLEYVDGEPVSDEAIPAPKKDMRPPDMADRPEYVGLNDIPSDDSDLPPAVALARKQFAAQQAAGVKDTPVTPVAHAIESDVQVESDADTLAAAGATDEIAMLRAQLDARNIKYHPTAKAPALRKKLG